MEKREETYGPAIFTSMGFTLAAWTLMRSSSGLVILGTGSVAMLYSDGLQCLGIASASIVDGIWDAIFVSEILVRWEESIKFLSSGRKWRGGPCSLWRW